MPRLRLNLLAMTFRPGAPSDAGVTLHCHSTEITFPRHAAASLDHVLRGSSFVVRDMPSDLDEAGKLVLIRRLIREGLVRRLS